MKSIVLIAILMCVCLASMMQMSTEIGYTKIEKKSIMGVWLLDEGKGDVVKDASGNGNDGKIVGAKWTDGKFGKALEFDGSSHVEIPASKTTDDYLDGFTYSIWVKPTAVPPNVNNISFDFTSK